MSTVIFVGPGTPNPDQTLIPQHGRFGPAIGAAWQVPWFGDGKTTVRGGFQRTYGIAGAQYTGGLVSGPGGDATTPNIVLTDPTVQGILNNRALNLSDLPTLIPARPTRSPGAVYPITGRLYSSTYGMFDPDYVTPYTDNFTFSISRTVQRNLTVDVRFVDTVGKKLPGTAGVFGTPGSFDVNTVNVYHNPELLKALEATRAGQDDPLFDQMLMGLNLNPGTSGFGAIGTPVNGVLQRGSSHLRRSATFATNLANGNYGAVVASLISFAPTAANLAQNLPIDPTTGTTVVTTQRLLRNGCDRIANNVTAGFTLPTGQAINPRCFPENFLIANPQLNSAIYTKNLGRTNYQSFETQVRWRATTGINLDATYSFSKTMQQPGSGFTDPLNPKLDYGKAPSSVGQEIRANGTVELPIGPNRLFLKNTSGWLARVVEHWQTSFILNLPSGYARNLSTPFNFLYANGRPDIVGPWDNPKGKVTWKGDTGYYFADGNTNSSYVPFPDPQCAQRVGGIDSLGTNLQGNCTLQALAKVVPQGTAGAILLPDGKTYGIPVLQNPLPGHQGNLGSYTMYTVSRWSLDANVSKAFQITESKQLQLRIDCTNVLNHPWPADPVGLGTVGQPGGTASNFSANNFGQILQKGGTNNGFPRQFQAKLRFSF
jgi:hypothetical protein